MLRKFLDLQLSLVEKGKPLHRFRPLVSALDTFLYEPNVNTSKGPHIRDAVDLKRWMVVVVFALLPCILMAIWNTGVQKFVYASGDYRLLNEFYDASGSFKTYFEFVMKDGRFLSMLQYGLMAFVPIMIISYAIGGLCEAIFAVVRGHEIAEGFLVTGMLYALILPPTIPYWMAAIGVAAGVIIGKEFFGGTGMNIVNPALTCRAFLFFTFPGKMSGDVWAGTNPVVLKDSLLKMNKDAGLGSIDGYSQATPLALFNVSDDIRRVHVDAIATNTIGKNVGTIDVIERQFAQWNTGGDAVLGQLTPDQLQSFVTSPASVGGLALGVENYQGAFQFSGLQYGLGHYTDANFFFGNQLGSMGETSFLACMLGALLLIWTRIGSWRTMTSYFVSFFACAALFQFFATHFGSDEGAWNVAKFGFPAYKHMLLGGLAFGIVFMATDPVSSPAMNRSKWFYGALVGVVNYAIRAINPAYPEGVMLAILLGNVFAPVFDYYSVRSFRRVRRVATN
jgi:Na+-transporting NADH:ubiquinone oxidoreductase subunit B